MGKKSRIYHTMAVAEETQDEDEDAASTHVVEALLESTAAPTYFSSYRGCIDGGIFANNPCLLALTSAVRHRLGKVEDARVLSLGTGMFPSELNTGEPGSCSNGQLRWGMGQWASCFVDLLLDGNTEAASVNTHNLLGDTGFFRLQPVLPWPIPLDDYEAVDALVELGNGLDLTPVEEWLSKIKM